MTGMSLVVFAGGLIAVFLLIVAALMWQEAKSRTIDEGPVYVIEDAIDFIHTRLDPITEPHLRRSDVQRILEWEIYYLQGLAQRRRGDPVETFAGGDAGVIAYLKTQILEKNGVTYDSEHIATVLNLEASYLRSIGAVGEAVTEEQETEHS